MKRCPQCNLEFPDHFQFCGSCGRSLATSIGEVAAQEWHAAPDLSEEETTAAAPIHERNRVREERATTPEVRPTPSANEATGAPMLTTLFVYDEPEAPSQFRWWYGVVFGFL